MEKEIKKELLESLMRVQQGLAVPKGQENKFGSYQFRSAEDILSALKPLLKEEKAIVLLPVKIEMRETNKEIEIYGASLRDTGKTTDMGEPIMKEEPILQKRQKTGSMPYCVAEAIYICEHGQMSCRAEARESMTKKGMDDSQITGSASSYARKYALAGLFGIDNEKDADHDDTPAVLAQNKAQNKDF